jgi:hypothetical protein
VKNYLVNYVPGARGDFLINVLRTIRGIDNNYSFSPQAVLKAHGENAVFSAGLYSFFDEDGKQNFNNYDELFDFAEKNNFIKIKIIGELFEEKLDIAYYNWLKNTYLRTKTNIPYYATADEFEKYVINDPNFKNEFLSKGVAHICNMLYNIIPNVQNDDSSYLNRYDHIIYFNKLFDIEEVKNIYKTINKVEMSTSYIKQVQANIDIQYRPSQSSNYHVFVALYQNYVRMNDLLLELN